MSPASLCIKRVLEADITRVFEAWSRAEIMARWFGCEPGVTAHATSHVEGGGKYRVAMSRGTRTIGSACGEYLEIVPPRPPVFTWRSEGSGRVDRSVVTVALTDP